ncbi:DUF433 domain-containing protein [Halalkaliarchaeum sp. AArc-GB]|uniref:DUF433 domain-containing protein n=1 Tax=Halalkaliarchaeum sp. AArc-GB TaxID=3074078 RepID=UPI0028551C44|nr:DUF433 domain-containing protein [Halalkaliarchaeum sp. AArc-GB]MDR5673655.1 DUF433 domain-containing protein [Halalkaliarchaeum sp. AArc-GB]
MDGDDRSSHRDDAHRPDRRRPRRGTPHRGTRIGVRHVAARAVDAGQPPAHVADQLGISLSEVYEALSYYYAHLEELREFERTNEAAFDRVENESLKPNKRVQ